MSQQRSQGNVALPLSLIPLGGGRLWPALGPRSGVNTLAMVLGLGLYLATASLAWAAEYTGIVHARHQLSLSVSVPGVVSKVWVEPGRRVQANEALLQLDDKLQTTEEQRRRTLLEDETELRTTEERLKLVQPLAEDARRLAQTRGALSREEASRAELDFLATRGRLEQLQAQKKRERLELSGAEQERAQRRLHAPVAGTVTKVLVDVGQWARPGDLVLELVDASQLQMRVNLPAAVARSLKTGQNVNVAFEAALQLAPAQATVQYVAPTVDAASGLSEVRLRIPNASGQIPPGIKAMLRLEAVAAR